MGQDKSQLQWNGIPLHQHMAGILNRAGVSQVMVSSNHLQGEEIISDKIPVRGPLSGIHAALDKVSDGDFLLVVPVDMPLLPVSSLQRLAQQKETYCYRGFTLPLLLIVSADLRQRIDKNIHSENRSDYSLWKLHKALQGKTMVLPESMADAFSNANTPEDWQECLALGNT
ncbi:hypothetical protein ACH42_03835 [Endozoicomonas sp. (ex Bugula neritina AB1)]|nr:hypothetical protein ACH42_03835 [Endozoicomonas sp. (ex Bugula neritina AB1)]